MKLGNIFCDDYTEKRSCSCRMAVAAFARLLSILATDKLFLKTQDSRRQQSFIYNCKIFEKFWMFKIKNSARNDRAVQWRRWVGRPASSKLARIIKFAAVPTHVTKYRSYRIEATGTTTLGRKICPNIPVFAFTLRYHRCLVHADVLCTCFGVETKISHLLVLIQVSGSVTCCWFQSKDDSGVGAEVWIVCGQPNNRVTKWFIFHHVDLISASECRRIVIKIAKKDNGGDCGEFRSNSWTIAGLDRTRKK